MRVKKVSIVKTKFHNFFLPFENYENWSHSKIGRFTVSLSPPPPPSSLSLSLLSLSLSLFSLSLSLSLYLSLSLSLSRSLTRGSNFIACFSLCFFFFFEKSLVKLFMTGHSNPVSFFFLCPPPPPPPNPKSSEESDDLGEPTRQAEAVSEKTKAQRSSKPANATSSDVVCPGGNAAGASVVRSADGTTLVGQTPPAIRHKHFTRLAHRMKVNKIQLAKHVLRADDDEKVAWLSLLYSPDAENDEATQAEAVESLADQSVSHSSAASQDPTVSSSGVDQSRGAEVEVGKVLSVRCSPASAQSEERSLFSDNVSPRSAATVASSSVGNSSRSNVGLCAEEILAPESSVSGRLTKWRIKDVQPSFEPTVVLESITPPSAPERYAADMPSDRRGDSSPVSLSACQDELELADLLFGWDIFVRLWQAVLLENYSWSLTFYHT